MRDIKIAAAQFENRNGDKSYNLAQIADMASRAASEGAEVISFHEGCVSGYSWIRKLNMEKADA